MTPLPRYLQLLWGREPEGRRGPKPGRSIEEIGAAAKPSRTARAWAPSP